MCSGFERLVVDATVARKGTSFKSFKKLNHILCACLYDRYNRNMLMRGAAKIPKYQNVRYLIRSYVLCRFYHM